MKVRSVCPLCSLCCGLWLTGEREIENLEYDVDHPVNGGALCDKGNLVHKLPYHEARLTTPLIREDDGYRQASWEEALNTAAEKLKESLERHGPASILFLSSGSCTNEENFLLYRLAEALGVKAAPSPLITTGLRRIFGLEASTGTLEGLAEADYVLIYGNPLEQCPVSARYILKAKFENAACLTVVDVRKSRTAWFSNVFLQPKPNTEMLLLAGMLKHLSEKELYDVEYVEKHVKGLKAFKEALAKLSMAKISEATGVPTSAIAGTAEGLARANKPYILYTASVLRHRGAEAVEALASLALLTCLPKEGGGLIALEGPPNAQGVKDLLAEEPKLQNVGFLLALGGLPSGLGKAGFTVSTQQFKPENPSEGVPDLVIPTACWAEKEGSLTNVDRLVQWLERAVKPPSNVKTDFEFLLELAERLGVSLPYKKPEDVWGDLSAMFPAYHNFSLELLKDRPERWGGGSLFREKFATRDGFARLPRLSFKAEVLKPDRQYPLIAVTEPRLFSQACKVASSLVEEVLGKPYGYVEVNPADAGELGLEDGCLVKLVADSGESLPLKVLVSSGVPSGVVFAPDYEVCRVRIERLRGEEAG
ncbi:MAG: molybdopterin oxidoreductase family protein [Candidatus Hecatellaceae archaeon]